MKKPHFLLIALILCLPLKTFALEVVDTTWEDMSHGVNSIEGSYGGQELYSLKNKIFLAQYIFPLNTSEVSFKYDFNLLLNDNSEWSTLIRYYQYSGITGSSSVINNQLVFQLDFDMYSVNKKGVITPLSKCETWHGKIMKFKKFIYIGCYKDLYRYNSQSTQTLQNSATNGTTFFENEILLALTFNKKLYLFSTDANDETVIYSRSSNDEKWKIINGIPFLPALFVDDKDSYAVVGNTLYVAATTGEIYYTKNLKTWKKINNSKSTNIVGMLGLDGQLLYLTVNDNDLVLYFLDVDTPRKVNIDGYNIYGSYLIGDEGRLYLAAYGDDGYNHILSTVDGENWMQLEGDFDSIISDMVATPNYLYAVTSKSNVYRTIQLN